MNTTPQSKSSLASPYILIFRDTDPDRYKEMTADQRARYLKQWSDWYQRLAEQGKTKLCNPLAPERRLVSGSRGQHVVDGPFAESKEEIVGFFLLNVLDLEEATTIAKECPGLAQGMVVELRAVVDMYRSSQTFEMQAAGLAGGSDRK